MEFEREQQRMQKYVRSGRCVRCAPCWPVPSNIHMHCDNADYVFCYDCARSLD